MKALRMALILIWLQAALLCGLSHAGGANGRGAETGERTERHRPQEPTRPYPYREEEVAYPNKKAAITLAGTLTLPESKGRFPAVILINGSGPSGRDEPVWGHRPFLVLADCFTRRGLAVLRFDKRGIGESEGNYKRAAMPDFADDVRAGIAYLKSRKDIDPRRIGLLGHSEGGMIGPMVAAESTDVAFVVMMAGTCVPMEQVVRYQWRDIAAKDGAGDRQTAAQLAVLDKILDVIKREKDHNRAMAAIRAVVMGSLKSTGWSRQDAQEKVRGIGQDWVGPWLRFYLTYDPKHTLMKVRCPVLAIFGEKDCLVEPKYNLPATREALEAGGNRDFLVREMPGLNHLLQHARTGDLDEYEQIEETISPEALKIMADWIAARTGAK